MTKKEKAKYMSDKYILLGGGGFAIGFMSESINAEGYHAIEKNAVLGENP